MQVRSHLTYPHRRAPDRETFKPVEKRVRENDSYKPKRIELVFNEGRKQ